MAECPLVHSVLETLLSGATQLLRCTPNNTCKRLKAVQIVPFASVLCMAMVIVVFSLCLSLSLRLVKWWLVMVGGFVEI